VAASRRNIGQQTDQEEGKRKQAEIAAARMHQHNVGKESAKHPDGLHRHLAVSQRATNGLRQQHDGDAGAAMSAAG
jgi:hypothetical protein